MRTLMLVSNSYWDDPRVRAEAESLHRNGTSVSVIGWDRAGEMPTSDMVGPVKVYWAKTKSQNALGWRQMFRLPLFWFEAIRKARTLELDVVHAHDFDTLPCAYFIAKRRRLALVYDSHESYTDQHAGRLPSLLVRLMFLTETWLMNRSTIIVTVGERLANHLRGRTKRSVVVIGNWKDEKKFVFSVEKLNQERARLGTSRESLVISYIGGLAPQRNVLPIIQAVKTIPSVHLILAGDGPQTNDVEEAVKDAFNVTFLGKVQPDEIALLTSVSDVIYYCLDPGNRNMHYSAPNKLFEAMAAGKAMIAMRGVGEVGQIVEEYEMGVLVENTTTDELRKAFSVLGNRTTLLRMQSNARQVYSTGYSWAAAEERLVTLYNSLTSQKCSSRS